MFGLKSMGKLPFDFSKPCWFLCILKRKWWSLSIFHWSVQRKVIVLLFFSHVSLTSGALRDQTIAPKNWQFIVQYTALSLPYGIYLLSTEPFTFMNYKFECRNDPKNPKSVNCSKFDMIVLDFFWDSRFRAVESVLKSSGWFCDFAQLLTFIVMAFSFLLPGIS